MIKYHYHFTLTTKVIRSALDYTETIVDGIAIADSPILTDYDFGLIKTRILEESNLPTTNRGSLQINFLHKTLDGELV